MSRYSSGPSATIMYSPPFDAFVSNSLQIIQRHRLRPRHLDHFWKRLAERAGRIDPQTGANAELPDRWIHRSRNQTGKNHHVLVRLASRGDGPEHFFHIED